MNHHQIRFVLLGIVLCCGASCSRYTKPTTQATPKAITLAFLVETETAMDGLTDTLGESLASDLNIALEKLQPSIKLLDRSGFASDPGWATLRNESTWQAFGRKHQASYLITGSIQSIQNYYVFTTRLYDVEHGAMVSGSELSRSCRRLTDLQPLIQPLSRGIAYQLNYLANPSNIAPSSDVSFEAPDEPSVPQQSHEPKVLSEDNVD